MAEKENKNTREKKIRNAFEMKGNKIDKTSQNPLYLFLIKLNNDLREEKAVK